MFFRDKDKPSFRKPQRREDPAGTDLRRHIPRPWDLKQRVEEFIEQYYNRRRLHSALGYRSPEQFEEAKAEANCDAAHAAAVVNRCVTHVCLNKGFSSSHLPL
jgi:hypothetical protein